jgi:cytochrome c-type biogenesis protein CcmH/NrfG
VACASLAGPRLCCLIGLLLLSCVFCSAQTGEARAHADRGLEFARSGDLASAEIELRQAVKLEPNNPEFLGTLGTLLAMDKKLEESAALFHKALQLAPADYTSRRYLAANLWQLHRYSEAKRELETILREHPNDPHSRLLLGMVSENSGDYATAAKMLSSVPDEVEKRPESMAALARSYYHLHEQAKARATLQRLPSHASNATALLLGAEIADQAGDHNEAEQLLKSISDSASNSMDIRYRKAKVQYHAGHFAECEKTLQLTDGSVGTAEAYNLLGWCDHRLNKPKEATAAFEQAIALAPAAESNYVDLIKVLEAHNFLRVALDAANHAAALFPNSAAVFNLKGSIESRLLQFTDAVASYSHALQLDRTNANSILGLARAQASAGQISDATSTFNTAIQRFPKDARIKVAYAEILLKQMETGDSDAKSRAEQLLRSAIAIDALNAEALYQLGNIELNDGRSEEARRHLEQAVKLLPQSSQPHFALARAYRRLNRSNDAEREMDLYNKLKASEPQRAESSGAGDQARN